MPVENPTFLKACLSNIGVRKSTQTPSPEAVGKQPRPELRELIGVTLRVEESSCKDLQGIEGVVVNETLNTFVLKTAAGGRKIVPKRNCIFRLQSGELLDGSLVAVRPEERTKRLWKESGRRKK
jgi:RNase P/RNase MRP subunit p29